MVVNKLQTLLDEYSLSHQSATNKLIHWICVPLIFFSVVGFLYGIKLPMDVYHGVRLNVAVIGLALVILYYISLSRTIWVGMLLFSLVCLFACYEIRVNGLPLAIVCGVIFIVAWIGQFYGHHIEGKRPSFLKDLQFLLIGPAWLMSFVYKKLGIAY